MPPQGMPRPDEATLDAFVASLETSIDRVALAKPEPRPVSAPSPEPLRVRQRHSRSARARYRRDGASPGRRRGERVRQHRRRAEGVAVAARAVPDGVPQDRASPSAIPRSTPVGTVYRVPPDRAQGDHIEGLPLGTRGGIVVQHNFPLDADYEFHVNLLQNIVGYVPGLEWPHQLEISIDGERVFTAPVGGEDDNKLSDTNLAQTKDTLDQRLRTRVPVKAGPRVVGVTFIRKNSARVGRAAAAVHARPRHAEHERRPAHRARADHRAVQCDGSRRHAEPPQDLRLPPVERARAKLPVRDADSARRWRAARIGVPRPTPTSTPCMGFFDAGRRRSGTFDAGIEDALPLHPDQPDLPVPRRAGSAARSPPAPSIRSPISSWRRGSRSSSGAAIPDDELLNVAAQGKLKDPAVLERQVRRMLADPRSKALVDNFAAQWLFLRNLQSFRARQRRRSRTSTTTCARRSVRRPSLFFESIMREDRNVLDLLTADYTFVNERLARHYGIPNVYGSRFRRVTLADENRRGLLGQGTVLAVTSYPEPHLAGAARQVDSGEHPRHAAAAAAAQRPAAQGNRRGRQGRCRSENAARTAPQRTRRARPVTGSWTRSASRSRISTRPAEWRAKEAVGVRRRLRSTGRRHAGRRPDRAPQGAS